MRKTLNTPKGWKMALMGTLTVFLFLTGIGLALAWETMGARPGGSRLTRLGQSPNFKDGGFINPVPLNKDTPADYLKLVRLFLGGQKRSPADPIPIQNLSAENFSDAPASGLRITWLGHSSALIEIDGAKILLDPVFADRVSPFSFAGPRRFFPPPISLEELPEVDAVIVSHDHYDHLDQQAAVALKDKTRLFVVPLGVGSHLEMWGIDPERIVELDWWEEKGLESGLRIVSCPARHFSGRSGMGNRTQWASWAIVGQKHRAFFSGDTGLMPLFEQVGQRYGPFDATLIKIGAYGTGGMWPGVHLNPEEALQVHRMVQGKVMFPIHWGTFSLSYHGWTEPVERFLVAAEKQGVTPVVPRPGQSIEPADPPAVERWWPDIPWQTAEKAPR